MTDVAALAGVSLKTVSRVVNGEPNVSRAMTQRVRAAIENAGYRHHSGASSLRRTGQATASLGLVLEDVSNPFSSQLHRAIEDAASECGYLVLVGSSDSDAGRERELIETFWERRVDGLIVVPSGDDHLYLQREIDRGTPVVFLDRGSDDMVSVDTVMSDNVEGSRAATEQLIRHGHRRIQFLGDDLAIETARLRRDGFRRAVAAAGLRPQKEVTGIRTTDAAEDAVAGIIAGSVRPTALFASQNLLTIGAIRALHRAGLEREIALVGFDDVALADLIKPSITVVTQSPGTLGRLAVETCVRRIAGDDSPPERTIVPAVLVPRGSGEIRRPRRNS